MIGEQGIPMPATKPRQQTDSAYRVAILGGGFGGLYAAERLGRRGVPVTLIDRRNFHLFQPLLYQVATGGLSPGDIASPLRSVLRRFPQVEVVQGEAVDIDVGRRRVVLRDGEVGYDTLVVATGSSHHYFGHDQWERDAPGLKTVEDALEVRRRILVAFEAAEREPDPRRREACTTFLVVGGGPTGVEMAGAIGELARTTLKRDFRHIDPGRSRIILVEGLERVLPGFPPRLSAKAARTLGRLGVEVQTRTRVSDIRGDRVTLKHADGTESVVAARTVVWAAGVQASPFGRLLARRTGCDLDAAGRVVVAPDLSLPGRPEIFVVGDLAHYAHRDGDSLPGLASVAIQEGKHVARVIERRLAGRPAPAFRYRDWGTLAVIGRNAAVVDFKRFGFNGLAAWLIWVFVHIAYLIGFDNKLKVLVEWAWNYFTRKRGARLITGTGDGERPALPPRRDAGSDTAA